MPVVTLLESLSPFATTAIPVLHRRMHRRLRPEPGQ
jgi:hypothetical protein